jgi:hypothetical protein
VKRMGCRVKPGNDDLASPPLSSASSRPSPRGFLTRCIQTSVDLLWSGRATAFQPGAREIVMAKGQMRSNKEKKKPKADKNLKKGGAAPVNPFAAGKTPAGQSPNSKK